MNRAWLAQRPVRVGISSCLLGDAVRFDGGHKRDAFLTDTFGRFVEWVPGHHVRVHDVAYLAGQVYLAPHPKELMLRNHV
jgi:hypothetical protein